LKFSDGTENSLNLERRIGSFLLSFCFFFSFGELHEEENEVIYMRGKNERKRRRFRGHFSWFCYGYYE
jgi:hypothetical protein